MSRAALAIEAIPTLPVYFKLADRRVLLAGGSLPAVWKLELLAAAGATVLVRHPAPCPEIAELASALGSGVEMLARPWQVEDFANCAMAVGVLEGQEAVRFRDAARLAGVPVNLVDLPDLCDFQFGTIIARPPLLIGISTDGAAPVFGQALRARIEALLPQAVQAWAQAAKDWRADLQLRELGFAARRRFWEAFSDLALDGTGRHPTEADRATCLRAALTAETALRGGLTLVGVGPGDPDLMTMRAVRALQSAEIIVSESGILPELLNLGRREALQVPESESLEQTSGLIRDYLDRRRSIAWVGVGDPATCRRWRERQTSLTKWKIAFEIVRGLPCGFCPDRCTA